MIYEKLQEGLLNPDIVKAVQKNFKMTEDSSFIPPNSGVYLKLFGYSYYTQFSSSVNKS